MDFNEHQKLSEKYDLGEKSAVFTNPALVEKVLGLSGEAGETADKFKKIIRDKNGVPSEEDVEAIKKELGDVLWYVANISRYLDISFSDVAETNLKKLESRYSRNKIHGFGDER